ncbi:hypothetical protein OKJ48_37775 [Streptomyces kunmingensis]|uniref:Zinc-finger domain-containing protein n=1 Tax=Streptomyces kunmingensis TaxID=68225 RepID=A0ABU6CNX6_9ACTN|nr:hypothetical protein [Streptomyces kunmingensis]MEB3965931.1 hypothetical protein [Streptomyces kunmingensis]
MTSTTDTAEHPEVAEISDLAEGLLPASRTSDLLRHLDGCVLCADVYASLEEIRGLLGTLPGPPRMPEEIAGRIDAALAAEALLDNLKPDAVANVTPAAAEEVPEEVPEEVTLETSDPVSRETSAAALGPAARSVDRPSGHSRAAVGPGRKPRTARRRTGAALGAVLTAAALGVGVLLLQGGGGETPTAGESGSADTFAEGSLDAKVSELLGTGGNTSPPPSTDKPSFGTQESGPKTPQTMPMPKRAATVPACVQLGTHRNEDPLAAEKGRYEGKNVYLVVLPHKTDPAHRVTAFIVDSACVKRASATGELLYTHDYVRG